MLRMWKRRAVGAMAVAAVAAAVGVSVRGQVEDPQVKVMSSSELDKTAAKEAIDGWWTEAGKTRDQRIAWWREARFGCFIHWGVYSALGGEYNGKKGGAYSEHIMRQLKIPRAEYLEKVAKPFNPEKFDAEEWVKLIKGAGMRYLVITAKHHDGFAMYPSKVSDFNIKDATKFGRDPMAELAAACKKEGVHFGFYYSHAFDWEHPDAPGNDWDYKNPGGDLGLFGGARWYDAHPELIAKAAHYVDVKAIPQLQELVQMYHPDIFWFDVGGKLPFSEQLRIVKAVRAADANVVINGRAARGEGKNWGDYVDTADNPAEVREAPGDWEAIPTVNSSYGYSKVDNNYKTPEFCVRLLVKIAAKGGNMLLNIGPKGDGTIDEHASSILQGIGKWMDVNGESIWGTTRTPLDRQAWGDSTVKGTTVYLHVFQWPSDGKLVVGGLRSDVKMAYLLKNARKEALHPLQTSRLNEKDVLVNVPSAAPDDTDSVIVLDLKGEMKGEKGRLLATNVAENQLLAFDGEAKGKFTYGDGKAGRWYAAGFTKEGDAISWKARVNEESTFEVTARYTAKEAGNLQVSVGEKVLSGEMTVGKTNTATTGDAAKLPVGMQTLKLGRVTIPAGEMVISVHSEKAGAEVSLFDVILTPAK